MFVSLSLWGNERAELRGVHGRNHLSRLCGWPAETGRALLEFSSPPKERSTSLCEPPGGAQRQASMSLQDKLPGSDDNQNGFLRKQRLTLVKLFGSHNLIQRIMKSCPPPPLPPPHPR